MICLFLLEMKITLLLSILFCGIAFSEEIQQEGRKDDAFLLNNKEDNEVDLQSESNYNINKGDDTGETSEDSDTDPEQLETENENNFRHNDEEEQDEEGSKLEDPRHRPVKQCKSTL